MNMNISSVTPVHEGKVTKWTPLSYHLLVQSRVTLLVLKACIWLWTLYMSWWTILHTWQQNNAKISPLKLASYQPWPTLGSVARLSPVLEQQNTLALALYFLSSFSTRSVGESSASPILPTPSCTYLDTLVTVVEELELKLSSILTYDFVPPAKIEFIEHAHNYAYWY